MKCPINDHANKTLLVFFLFIIFRFAAGKATMLATQFDKAIDINSDHFSEEHLADLFSSFILPKHSPLKVLLHNCKGFWGNIYLTASTADQLLPWSPI
jgi:hypothetical protein